MKILILTNMIKDFDILKSTIRKLVNPKSFINNSYF